MSVRVLRHRCHWLGLALALVLSGMLCAQSATAETLSISSHKREDAVTVALAKVMSEAYRRIGFEIEFQYLPSERALMMANAGQVDGELYRIGGIEADYPHLLRVPVPIYTVTMVVFTKDANFRVDGWQSLRPYSIGHMRGVKAVEMNTLGMRTDPANSQSLVYQKLLAGRTDVVVNDRNIGWSVIRSEKLAGIRELSPPLEALPLYHYLHEKHRALVPRLQKVLEEMRRKKEIERITREVFEKAGALP